MFGKLAVQISVANVKIYICLETLFHIVEHMFCRDEIYTDLTRFPERFLGRRKTIRAAADQKPEILGSLDHVYGDPARWVSKLKGAVDVKTYQEDQLSTSA